MGTGSDSSGSAPKLLWMMIALFTGFGVLVGGAFFTASRILSLQYSGGGTTRAVHTAAGEFRVQRPSEVGPGMPIYPGAVLVLPGNDVNSPVANRAVQTAIYHSTDPRDAVDHWYAEHLSREFVRHDSRVEPFPQPLRNTSTTASDIAFLGERGDQLRIVTLSEDSTGTKIALERTTKH